MGFTQKNTGYWVWILYLFYPCIIMPSLHAQPLSFKHLTVEQGLSQNTIHSLYVDQAGFLWMGTADGLNRFDGYQVVSFRHAPHLPGGMMNTSVLQIVDDAKGRIWILGEYGLECLLPGTQQFKTIVRHSGNDTIRQIQITSTDTILTATSLRWTYRIRISDFSIQQRSPISASNGMPVANFAIKSQTNYWQVHESKDQPGLFCFHGADRSPICRQLPIPPRHLSGIPPTAFQREEVWFTTRLGSKMWMHRYNPRTHQLLASQPVGPLLDQIGTTLNKLLAVPDKNRWYLFNNQGELLVMDSTLQTIAYYPFSTPDSDGLGARFVMDALWYQQTMWVATNPGGLAYATPGDRGFSRLQKGLSKQSTIKNIFTWHPDSVYACLVGEGMVRFNRLGEATYHPPELPAAWSSPGHFAAFNSMTIRHKRQVTLFGSQVFGEYDARKRLYTDYWPRIESLLPDLVHNINYAHTRTPKDELYFNKRNRLYRFKPAELASLSRLQPLIDLPADISALEMHTDGSIWIGTTGGLFHWTGKQLNRITACQDAYVKSIRIDDAGALWIATTRGLCRYQPITAQSQWYTSENGLANNFVYGSLRDSSGQVWLSTNYGLAKLNPNSGRVTNYFSRDGLTSNEFNSNSFFADDDGRLYFGAIGGINVFNPASFQLNMAAPAVRLIQLRVNDQVYSDSTRNTWQLDRLTLPYYENTITLQFAGLYLPNAGLQQYRYRLEGVDTGWIYTIDNRTVRYPKLAAGSYRFVVQCSLDGVKWNHPGTTLFIQIEKPYYQQVWFLVLVGLLVATAAFFGFRLVLKWRLRRQQRELELLKTVEEERRRISRDLHDNMGAYTSALLSNVEQLRNQATKQDLPEIDRMEDNARQILGSLRETIWVLNNQSIRLERFSDEFKAQTLRLLQSFPQINLVVQESDLGNGALAASTAIHVRKIMQELVQNAIKHAAPTSITYRIERAEHSPNIIIQLSDNGKGFLLSEHSHGQGLENMRWRAEQARIDFQLDSTPTQGTTARLILRLDGITPK